MSFKPNQEGYYCPSCQEFFEPIDPYLGFWCPECTNILTKYIKLQRLWDKEIKAGRAVGPETCVFCNGAGKLQDGSECPH